MLSVVLTASGTGTTTGTQKIYIGIIAADLNQWTELEIWDLKLEKGETATAYSAAPEDSADYLYTTLNATINLTAEALRSEMTSKIGESEDRITSQHTSLIQQKADEILAQVEAWDDELGASISEIRQTATSISLKVQELAGYENLVTNNSTGNGWAKSNSDGEFVKATPTNGNYYILNDTTSPRYLRTPLFTLKANTKYTLSFAHSAISTNTNGLGVYIKYGDTATVLTSRTYQGAAFSSDARRETFTFATGSSVVENAFVEFAHLGMKAGVQMGTNFVISEVILEIGEVAHPYVEDATGLLATGIDIYNRRIVFTADNIIFQNNDGSQSMFIDENGRILAKFINVEELRVNHLVAGDENGQRVEIDPEIKSIEIYNNDNELCTTINGESHDTGVSDLYGNSQEGTINTGQQNGNGYVISNGQFTVDGDSNEVNKTVNVYSDVWQADSPTSAIMGVGNVEIYAYSSGYTENKGSSSGGNKLDPIQIATMSSASGYVYISLEVADDANFTKNKRSWTIYSTGASACASMKSSEGLYDPGFGGDSGVYHPSDYAHNTASSRIVDGKSAKATKRGYCRLCMRFNASVNHQNSYVTFKWGSKVTSGRNLTATWKNEFYISNFFANGFCLGIRKDKYIIAYKDGNGNMHFEMEEEGIGFKFSKNGIQTKHHNGNWMNMPLLVWKAKIRRYSTSGDYANKYYIDSQKSFNSDSPSWTNLTRTEPAKSHIHVYIPFPASWQVLAMTPENTIVNLTGYGDEFMKGTLVNITNTGMTVEISDDATANDGTLLIELFII